MTHRLLPGFSAVVLAVVLAACGPAPTSPSPFAAYSQTDLRVGTGDEAVNGQTVGVHYTLWLYDSSKTDNKGLRIESSPADEPFEFQLGGSGVIEGWNRGIAGMRVGGQRRLVIPPDLAYGDSRRGTIPPNATLVFDVELVSAGAP